MPPNQVLLKKKLLGEAPQTPTAAATTTRQSRSETYSVKPVEFWTPCLYFLSKPLLGSLCKKLQIQDGHWQPFWILAAKLE